MAIVSPEDHARFQEEGYLTIETGLPPEVLDGVVRELDGQYPPLSGEDPVTQNTRLHDAWTLCRHVHAIAIAPRILDVLRELYHREPKPFQTLNFPVGTSQAAHADTLHFNSLPHGFMCGVWVALEDMDEDNGPVYYYPKSHQLPEFGMHDAGTQPGYENYLEYERFIDRLARHFGLEPRLAVIPKGHALIWSANLLHGGAPRRDPGRSRHSQVTHYFFERCRYYTPMFSHGVEVAWREPNWIPLELPPPD
ncbi:MAG: phytanoyl-CoA dioxygenase family protein [Planctomycetes bacterium]|nr:phytanoyl-CoA dioxygenase family protein [Planctomycetota bacterium]MCB9918789.1 phytanoyl-CoA dioxygenase family protein [Planctomycetota bacterium]